MHHKRVTNVYVNGVHESVYIGTPRGGAGAGRGGACARVRACVCVRHAPSLPGAVMRNIIDRYITSVGLVVGSPVAARIWC